MANLRNVFPQITICSCFTRLPSGVDGREFGFWLFNRSVPTTPEEREQRLYTLLLVFDAAHQTLSATVGYGLDCFLDDIVLSKSLDDAKDKLRHKGIASGIQHWLKLLSRRLVPIHDAAHYEVNRHERRATDEEAHGDAAFEFAPEPAARIEHRPQPVPVSQGYRDLPPNSPSPEIQAQSTRDAHHARGGSYS